MERQPISENTSASVQRLIQLLWSSLNSPKTEHSLSNQVALLNQMQTTLLGSTWEAGIFMLLFSVLGIMSESVSSKKGKSSPEDSPPPTSLGKSETPNYGCGGLRLGGGSLGSWTPTIKSSSQTSTE